MIKSNVPSRLVFKRPADGLFQISSKAIEQMLGYTQYRIDQPESGGVILGRHILDTNNIVVDMVTKPTVADRQSRNRFFRSRQIHQQHIDEAWKNSSGTCTYLGEWHTHP